MTSETSSFPPTGFITLGCVVFLLLHETTFPPALVEMGTTAAMCNVFQDRGSQRD